MRLMDIVRELEQLPNTIRKYRTSEILNIFGIPIDWDHYIWQNGAGVNFIVHPEKKPYVIISCHHDTCEQDSSPGANDNASAVAVTIDLMKRFQEKRLANIGVMGLFFDEEELGCKGSEAYVRRHKKELAKVLGVYNVEMVGSGNIAALWPLNQESDGLLLRSLEEQARYQATPVIRVPHVAMRNSDHRRFLEAGVKDAFCLTMISEVDLAVAREYEEARAKRKSDKDLQTIMDRAPIFRNYHKPTDKSEFLSEESMKLASDLLYGAILRVDENRGK